MSDPITVRFSFDRRLFPRALMGWWQSAVPRPSFINRVIVWALVWGGLLMVTLALGALGIAPVFVGAGVIGAGILVVGFVILQRLRMRRFVAEIGSHWDRAGETEATFSADGVIFRDTIMRSQLDWSAIDAIVGFRGGTVLRFGISMVAIPDRALPEGLRPRAFRQRLDDWRAD